jgi:predicted nucleic acid-binding protein
MGKYMKYILDTNVLIRFLVGDSPAQKEQAVTWFRQAEKGVLKITVHPIVVAETCYVLESFYKKSRTEIANTMQIFLSQRWLDVVERETLIAIWDPYQEGLHFVDSFLLIVTKQSDKQLLTFDKKLLKKT